MQKQVWVTPKPRKLSLIHIYPEAQIIAGGSDVLVQMREGKRAGKALISIQKCGEMRGISIDDEMCIRDRRGDVHGLCSDGAVSHRRELQTHRQVRYAGAVPRQPAAGDVYKRQAM